MLGFKPATPGLKSGYKSDMIPTVLQMSHVMRLWYFSSSINSFFKRGTKEPCHEIMVLFILHKFILQTCMRSHPVGLDVRFVVGPFVYFHTLCVRTVKALARLRGCAGSPEPSLVAYVISTIISWAGSNVFQIMKSRKYRVLMLVSCPGYIRLNCGETNSLPQTAYTYQTLKICSW